MTNRRRVSMLCAILIALGNGMFLHPVSQASSSAIQTSHFLQNPVQSNELPFSQETGSTAQKGGFQPAATFIVTNQTQLATAITMANGNNQPDIINITADISLTSSLPIITADNANPANTLTINGSGGHRTIMRTGGLGFRIFFCETSSVVVLNDLTLSGGVGSGGGIQTLGSLTVTNCTVSNNSGGFGGGILIQSSATANFTNCTVSNNSAGGFGGGILIQSSATANFTNCTISGNTGALGGGGIGDGGGIDSSGQTTLTNCTISGNSLAGTNRGGGINQNGGSLTLTNCTVFGNSTFQGGGINNNNGTVNLTNTIVYGNTATVGPDIFGAIATATNNLVGTTANSTGITGGMNGNIVGMDPVLSPLAFNGGPTQTQAIGCMSPARDVGTPTGAPATDQRGMGRDAAPDIGAFEATTIDCPLPGGLMVADTTNHRIQVFDGNVWSMIGVGTVGNGPGQFRLPEAVTFSPDGQNIYVADTGNNRVQFSTDGGMSWSDLATNGIAANQVKAPQGVALDSDGNLYVSDTGNGRVLRFAGGMPGLATVLASNGIGGGQVRSPRGLMIDSTFRLFVTDQLNSRVLRIANASTVLTSTSGVAIATSGTALNKVNAPQGITIDSLGDVYVADTGNNRILRWRNANPNNSSTMALAGSLLGQVTQAEGVTITQFSMGPYAGGPMLIVGDTGNNRIEGRFIPTGGWQLIGAPNGIGTGIGQFRAPSKIR